MSTVLLTGSTGFIGSSLITYLEENSPKSLNDILVLSSVQHPKLKTILYDVNSFILSEIIDVTSVIHLGAFIPKNNIEVNDIERCTSNITFTKNLLNTLPTTIDKFIFISTTDVYKKINLINEDSIVEPAGLYGWSKLSRVLICFCRAF